MAKENRENVWLQCTETGDLNYRTEIKIAGGPQKIEVKKFSPRLRRHTTRSSDGRRRMRTSALPLSWELSAAWDY